MAECLRLLLTRRERRLTQVELAHLAGISTTTLYRIERGVGGPPAVETLQRLAAVLDTTPAQLFPELLKSKSAPTSTSSAA